MFFIPKTMAVSFMFKHLTRLNLTSWLENSEITFAFVMCLLYIQSRDCTRKKSYVETSKDETNAQFTYKHKKYLVRQVWLYFYFAKYIYKNFYFYLFCLHHQQFSSDIFLACYFAWPSTDVKLTIKVQAFWTIEFHKSISRALEVLIAVRSVWLIVTINL